MDTHASVPPVRYTWTAVQYPFLVIRVLPGVFSLRPLPRDLGVPVLRALSWSAMEACSREFRMALVFGAGQALYLEPDGGEHVERDIPWYQPLIDFDPPALAFLPGSGAATENPDDGMSLAPAEATQVPSTEQSATPAQEPPSVRVVAPADDSAVHWTNRWRTTAADRSGSGWSSSPSTPRPRRCRLLSWRRSERRSMRFQQLPAAPLEQFPTSLCLGEARFLILYQTVSGQ